MFNATPWPLYPRGRDPVTNVQETGWAPGPVWTGTENLAQRRDSIPGPSSPQRIAISTTLSRCSTAFWDTLPFKCYQYRRRLIAESFFSSEIILSAILSNPALSPPCIYNEYHALFIPRVNQTQREGYLPIQVYGGNKRLLPGDVTSNGNKP